MKNIPCKLAFLTRVALGSLALTLCNVAQVQAQMSYRASDPGKPSSGEEYTVAKGQERIQIDMVRQRRNRTEGGDYDDKTDRIKFTLKLTNSDLKKEHKDLKAIVVLTGKNVVEKKKLVGLLREEFEVDLGIGKPANVQELETKEVSMMYDDNYAAKGGERYDGWLVALLNKDNEIVAYKTSKETFTQNIVKIAGLDQDLWFDLKLMPIDPPMSMNRAYQPLVP